MYNGFIQAQAREARNSVRGSLPRARRRLGDHIAPVEEGTDRPGLHGRRPLEPDRRDAAQNALADSLDVTEACRDLRLLVLVVDVEAPALSISKLSNSIVSVGDQSHDHPTYTADIPQSDGSARGQRHSW